MKGNIHRKATYEDKFDRALACWVKNNPKTWRWYKKQNIRKFRKMVKQEIQEERGVSHDPK